jgi:hypothetical protein
MNIDALDAAGYMNLYRKARWQVATSLVAWGFSVRSMTTPHPDHRKVAAQLAMVYAGRARHGVNI